MGATDVLASRSLAAEPVLVFARRRQSRGFWSDAAVRLFKNPAATASAVFIGLLLVVAAFAPWIAPYA